MATSRTTVGLVEDHPLMRMAVEQMIADAADLTYLGGYGTLTELLRGAAPHIVLLDLRLADRSKPAANVIRARRAGAKVLVYTTADDPYTVRTACQAGAAGVVRKSDPPEDLLHAIRELGSGREVAGLDWASALDTDRNFVANVLTESERCVLSEYACGRSSQQVAHRLGLSPHTVNSYVRDIRAKYEANGRGADSRVDLYVRAVQDSFVPGPLHHVRPDD